MGPLRHETCLFQCPITHLSLLKALLALLDPQFDPNETLAWWTEPTWMQHRCHTLLTYFLAPHVAWPHVGWHQDSIGATTSSPSKILHNTIISPCKRMYLMHGSLWVSTAVIDLPNIISWPSPLFQITHFPPSSHRASASHQQNCPLFHTGSSIPIYTFNHT